MNTFERKLRERAKQVHLTGEEFPAACMCLNPKGGIKAAFAALEKHGVTMIGEYMDLAPTFHMFRIADPAGNVIEFAGEP